MRIHIPQPCPKEKCLQDDLEHYEQLRVIYLVKSAVGNFERRKVIRQTWGFEKRFADVPIRTVFLLGEILELRNMFGNIITVLCFRIGFNADLYFRIHPRIQLPKIVKFQQFEFFKNKNRSTFIPEPPCRTSKLQTQ
jgi:hypothetical protein